MPIVGRVGRLETAVPPIPEHVYRALMTACTALDVVDSGGMPYVSTSVANDVNGREDARAWMFACLLLMDRCDIDTMTVKAIANDVWKGAQDALY